MVLVPASKVKRDKQEAQPLTPSTPASATKSARPLSECSTSRTTFPLQPVTTKPNTEEAELRKERLQQLAGCSVSLSQTDVDEVKSDPESLSGNSNNPGQLGKSNYVQAIKHAP